MRIFILFVLFFILVCSCKSKNLSSPKIEEKTFSKNIFPQDSFWYNIKLNSDTLTCLSSVEKGIDSFVFRFWVDQQLIRGNQVFEIKFENNKWNSTHYFSDNNITDSSSKEFYSKWLNRKIVHDTVLASQTFEIDIDSFFYYFKKYDLQNLPTQSSLKDYSGCCDDGVVYYYEIATKNNYKFCVYENPQCCKEKNIKNQIFLDFLEHFKTLLKPCEYGWPLCKIDSTIHK